jgi:hypothetical protein
MGQDTNIGEVALTWDLTKKYRRDSMNLKLWRI